MANRIHRGTVEILADISRFTRLVVGVPLRGYQIRPLRHVIRSVLHREGREYLLIFPRQSGKNEAVAQLLVYLMNLLQRREGQIVYGATGKAALSMAIERLEGRLDNPWNRHQWQKRSGPPRFCLGRCQVLFVSTHPSAASRGQTAHRLLVIDELQNQVSSHLEAVFTPMRAANNATALYMGTVKTTGDCLWQKKRELEAEQRADGHQRVFMTSPQQVAREAPDYQRFLANQVRKHGRHHPIVASEYYLEPIDASGGLFPPERRLLMRGFHARQSAPRPGATYVATVDVAGEDEAATDPLAQLARPGRDYTVATVFEVVYPGRGHGSLEPGGRRQARDAVPGAKDPGDLVTTLPTYRAVDVFVDQGSKHFFVDPAAAGPAPGDPPAAALPLAQRLRGWLERWGAVHVVADASGVGQGLVSWLQAALGRRRVTGFQFGPQAKAALGSAFVALVETGRFHYWTGDEETVLSDGWWFWRQVEACGYDLPPDGRFDKDLRWEVPPGHRTDTPAGMQPTHDDRLVSAALVAEVDRLVRHSRLRLGTAQSSLVEGEDPLGGEVY